MSPIFIPIVLGAVAAVARAAAAHVQEEERANRERLCTAAEHNAQARIREARARWTEVVVAEAAHCERVAADPRVDAEVSRALVGMARDLRHRA